MKNKFDHILLIGFGGPGNPDEIMPFLRQVTAGRNIPDERLKVVAHHYELIGGKSPYNPWAAQLQKDLSKLLDKNLPVFLGYRNTAPFLKDVLLEIHDQGFRKGIAVILAPFRSGTSCRRYKENIHEALHHNGIMDLNYSYVPAWYNHSDLIKIIADSVKETVKKVSVDIRPQTEVFFSCHSIPLMMDKECPICIYSGEYEAACRLVAEAAGLFEWKHVYQSRSGNPGQPWLEPDILDSLKNAAAAGKKAVIVIPLGFLCDNVEVLYDLDIEAKNLATELGLEFHRVVTPGNHPALSKMFAELIQQIIHAGKDKNTCTL